MELSEKAEEILESLAVAEEKGRKGLELAGLDEKLGGAPRSTELASEELTAAGLAAVAEGRIHLTAPGRQEARGVLRRHYLAERLLSDVLNVSRASVEETACRFEHLLRKGIDDQVCTLLGHPKVCPHGRPIPPGDCCREQARSSIKLVAPLSELEAGRAGRIAYVHAPQRSDLQKLLAMGALPGAAITLQQTFPSFVFRVGNTQVAVDREIANSIYVRPTPETPRRSGLRRRFRLGRRR